jgi:hypothetical protein
VCCQSLSHSSAKSQGGIASIRFQGGTQVEEKSLCFRPSGRDLFRRSRNPSHAFDQGEGAQLLIPKSFRHHIYKKFKWFIASEAKSLEALKSRSESPP